MSVSYRRIMTSRFDPIPGNTCYRNQKVPYMPPITAAAEDDILAPYGWPKGVLGDIGMVFCTVSPALPFPSTLNGKTPPIVLFSPGLNTSRLFYSAIAQEVASKGFTVITIDHPYETDIVEFPDGTVAYGGNVNISDISTIYHALDIRMNDVSFVLDTLGLKYDLGTTPKAVMFGHSFGGAATAAAMMNDTRVRGGVNLDGSMFGGVINAGLGRPGINQSFILWGSTGHNSSSDADWGKFYSVLAGEGQWKRELSVKGSVHGSYWDLGLIADVADVRKTLTDDEETLLIGKLPGARVIDVQRDYLNDFFRFVLEGAGEGLLAGPSPTYPEVLFLRE
jgi:pimeloyl-ACP methyl ester carboxylesterase